LDCTWCCAVCCAVCCACCAHLNSKPSTATINPLYSHQARCRLSIGTCGSALHGALCVLQSLTHALLCVRAGAAVADIPKALLGAAVVRDGVRPIWPGSSSGNVAAAGTAATSSTPASQGDAAAAAPPAELFPPAEYRRLAEACWQHEPQDRWGVAGGSKWLTQL
jgi:hypothetical protein